ncbi:MAG: DUF4279 domain-containing protein [Acidobacteria bacterium]|nr:DUF4279 domain-containing protein [Acidobacteriota bacterium]
MIDNKTDNFLFLHPIDDSDESCERTCAELRIYSGKMKPSEVTEIMGIKPTEEVIAGEKHYGIMTGRVRIDKVNCWFLSSETFVISKDLRRHLDWIYERLEPRTEAIKLLQAERGVEMLVHCIWWSQFGGGGPTLWPKQMRNLADLNLECTFDFQYYGDEE